MINNTIAKRYAKALVQLGSEGGLIDLFREELAGINTTFMANADLRAAFANPAFTAEQKKEIMQSLVTKSGCSELVGNFLLLLVDKNRVAFLALDDSQVASIQGALEKKTGKKVVPQVTVDSSLLGGVVIQIGDTAFDSSVKTQLKRIQDILQKG